MSFEYKSGDKIKVKFSKTGTNSNGMWQIVIPEFPPDRKLPSGAELIIWNTSPIPLVEGDMVEIADGFSFKIGAKKDEYNGNTIWKTQISINGKLTKAGSASNSSEADVAATWVSMDEDDGTLPF